MRWNNHVNDFGDWCPHSESEVAEDSDGRCPVGCRESAIEEDSQ